MSALGYYKVTKAIFMDDVLRILHLEDVKSDAELIERELKKGGLRYEKIVVDNRESFLNALIAFKPGIVISDHSLPMFSSTEALRLLQQMQLDVPFILVTATISEEFAVEMIKMGADDYILKDRLQRLPNAILNTLDKRRLENERRASEANLRTIFDNTDTAYILFTPQQQVVSFNNQATVFGRELFGKDIKVGAYTREYFSGKRQTFVDKAFEDAAKGEGTSYENSFFSKNDEVKWYHSRWFGTMDNARKHIGVMLAISDITERKLVELEMEKIARDIIQRNNALEQFAYIVSHNLRAPVANIIALSDSLASWGDDDEAQKPTFIKALSVSAKKLDDVVLDLNHILRISQRINEKMEIVYFSQLVEDLRMALNKEIRENRVTIKTNFTGVMNVYSLKSYLYNIFYNLVTNSINFRKLQLPPVIEITTRVADGMIQLTFADNGKGIDLAKFGTKIFGLYQRFDNSVEGRGVGLCMVKTQVETLGGSIKVESALNKGTQFTILLPV